MGWLWTNKQTKEQGIAELLQPWTHGDGITSKVLAHSLRGRVLWTVRERSDGVRWIGCDLTSTKGGGFGYKSMDESMGPCEVNCPLSYLDMVPDPGSYATEWRKRVRAWHALQRQRYVVGARYSLHHCIVPYVTILSAKPLLGMYEGRTYRIPRARIGERINAMEGK
jgi:hypothetical protein